MIPKTIVEISQPCVQVCVEYGVAYVLVGQKSIGLAHPWLSQLVKKLLDFLSVIKSSEKNIVVILAGRMLRLYRMQSILLPC